MQATLNEEWIVEARIDPALVPQRTLSSGARMPAIGLGTFGSDHVSAVQIAQAVKSAARIGSGILIAPPYTEMKPRSARRLWKLWLRE